MLVKPSSLLEFIKYEDGKQNEVPMKKKITKANNLQYLNYELTPDTWNMLVNKQVYMKFERLFIEKQLIEKKRKEDAILQQIESIEKEKENYIA